MRHQIEEGINTVHHILGSVSTPVKVFTAIEPQEENSEIEYPWINLFCNNITNKDNFFREAMAFLLWVLTSLVRWVRLKIYQYEVTFAIYMLTPTEKFIFSTLPSYHTSARDFN